MAVVPCPACQKPMNAAAVVCPHCNARRGDVATGLAGKSLSPAELRALVVSATMLERPPAQGLVSALVLPHPGTAGGARAAELALTLISLPLVAIGALTLAVTRRRREVAPGELAPVMAMLGVGGLGFASVLSLLGASLATNLVLSGVSVAALIVRGVIRARAARSAL